MNIHIDDQRLAYFNVFPAMPVGQINVVRLYPGSICAWHRHERQTDTYFCVAGVVKVGIIEHDEVQWAILDARQPTTVKIPPLAWHGYAAVGGEATLLQYMDRKYDPADEERRAISSMDLPWETAPQ